MASTNNSKKHAKDELSQLFLRHLPYWPYFVISLVVCAALAVLYLHFKTPVYQTTASILIKKTENRSPNDNFISPMDVFSSQKMVENETAVLRSYSLMSKVVKRLGLCAPVSVDRDLLKGELGDPSGYFLAPVKVHVKNPDSIVVPREDNEFYFQFDGKQVTMNGKTYPLNEWKPSPWGSEIKFVPNAHYNPSEDDEKRPMYFSLLSVNQAAHRLIQSLGVSASGQMSSIINLSYRDKIPERGKSILNTVIFYYNQGSRQYKSKLATNMIGFLDNRITRVKNELDSIETTLQNFKSTKGGVGLDNQSQLILSSLSENDKKISEIDAELATLNQIKKYVKGNGGDPGVVALSNQDNVLTNYLEKLYDAELKYGQLKKTTAENNTTLLSLKDQINRIKPTIIKYVDNRIGTLQINKMHLQGSSRKYNSRLNGIPSKQRRLLELNRKKTNVNDLYDFLLQKREEATLSYGAKVSDTKIVDHAIVHPVPVSPKKSLVMGLAFILGLAIPVVFLKFNKKALTKEDIKDTLGQPVLGEVAGLTSKEPYLTSREKYNLVSEQFRQIRISLAFSQGMKSPHKKIMVTSSIAGEGKSFVAANLAINLTLANKKVLLIDLDLHQPKIDKRFQMENEVGISDYLLGRAGIKEIIAHPKEENDHLFVISSGEILPEPSETILNGRLARLLDEAEDQFDYIVVDTSPVNIISDGYNISELCDTSLYVVRYKYTPLSELISFRENSSSRQLKNMAVVFNGVKTTKARKYRKTYYSYVQGKGVVAGEKQVIME